MVFVVWGNPRGRQGGDTSSSSPRKGGPGDLSGGKGPAQWAAAQGRSQETRVPVWFGRGLLGLISRKIAKILQNWNFLQIVKNQ